MPRTAWILVIIGLIVMFTFFGWALTVTNPVEELSRGNAFTTTVLLSGVVVSSLLGGLLMWLAFRSSKRGFDDRANHYIDEDIPPPR